ncbi:uncharacterized protein TOT_040000026 [Theileria orientalis strain Shintoku]|uniref:ABC transporter n=1 Tax=Theileria orientalis strain Shintoku TaxID=869250 RepID=J4D9W8_THEOR|nr:uncharacterized protein TOT_040000026 [Theileria orientalis strain Shintoku]BAM41645.1 uncharacterized protein TOT_040000026 [Theileria orientalis strain Shintoku]|eukprot:XP_009691946.1 uncharacterized protein TOT_040000026 [Theileria orientalis strain Shintoku]
MCKKVLHKSKSRSREMPKNAHFTVRREMIGGMEQILMGDDNVTVELTEECNFWESEVNQIKKCSQVQGKKVTYYDSRSVFNFIFFNWTRKWIGVLAGEYLDPYKLHPLPKNDQILYWQPVFSKYVSDKLMELEREEYESSKKGKMYKPRKLIIVRAILYTFWKRILLATIGMVVMNIMSMSIAILMSSLLKQMTSEHSHFRLIVMLDYSLGITLFQHALCLRRNYANKAEGQSCNNAVHWSSEGSKCSENPLLCPARRHKNMEITPKVYSYKFVDCYYVTLIFDTMTDIVTFLTNFIYGIILIHVKMKLKIWTVFIVSVGLLAFMILVEIGNSFLLNKSFEIITSFKLIQSLTLEDLADNMITDTRNDELTLVVYRFFLSLINKILYSVCVTCAILIIIKDFVEQLKRTQDVKSIDASSIITLLFILLKIIDPMYLLPLALRLLIIVINSYNRLEFYIRSCSPNYYQYDKFLVNPQIHRRSMKNSLGHLNREFMSYVHRISDGKMMHSLANSVIRFQKASFSWVYSREDALTKNKAYLDEIDFTLARGEIAIVTGSQGSGKTNFVKAVLGEMTLVGGSMFVFPLSKSIPVFYASQEVWLKSGTIRSNIVFGHIFDEKIYEDVVRAIELETDMANWEDGDLRVISESGYGLSGGQRVRVEFARAVYAYMIYSKVRREYAKPGSFLMCLDSIFVGLDPFVGGNIFNNLFNNKNGLLVTSDLSVVLTASKRSLETCLATSSPESFGEIKIYSLKNNRLRYMNDLKGFIKRTITDKEDGEMYKRCKSTDFERLGRRSIIREKYGEKKTIVFGPLLMYIKSAGRPFYAFLLMLIVCTVLDKTRYIMASRLSNFVNDQIKDLASYADNTLKCEKTHSQIKEYSTKSFNRILWLSVLVIVACVSVVLLMTLVSFLASLKIHEYSLDSALHKSSMHVKVKRYVSDIITFLSCDTLYIDKALGYYLYDAFVLLVETFIHMIMLIYLVPTSFFFVLFASFLMVRFPVMWFIKALTNIRFAYMASINKINCVLNDSISGSLNYRSYRKEEDLVSEFVEHSDYNARCRFMERASYTWTSVVCRCIFSGMIFFVILTPLTISTVTSYNIKIGYYGLAFSFSLNFTNRFSKLLRIYTRLQLYLCSVKRFENFIPSNEKLEFSRMKNIYLENIIVTGAQQDAREEPGKGEGKPGLSKENTLSVDSMVLIDDDDLFNCEDATKLKNKYLQRRKREFYQVRSRMSVRSLLFKPVIKIIDVTEYVDHYHKGVKLKGVYVLANPTKSLSQKPEELANIVKTEQVELKEVKVEGKGEPEVIDLKDEQLKKRLILSDINQEAFRSHIIGVVGRTGAGKTTLLSVLLNTAKVRKGSVLLDGVDLNDIPKAVLRQIVGVLPQLPFVFRGWTIRTFLDPRKLFSDGQIYEALKMCGLIEFVQDLAEQPLDLVILPDNLTSTMDAKIALSNTQMRTLMFARLMLYRKFYRIILIDEPPSDNCSEDQTPGATPRSGAAPESQDSKGSEIGLPVYKLLKDYFTHCTTFIAAHDVNALKACTKLWILSRGNLVMTCDREQMLHDDSLSRLIQECMDP